MTWVRAILPLVFVILVASSAGAQDQAEPQRPTALLPLYVSQIALHGLDLHSTLSALARGHREANPLFNDATAGRLIGAKMASSALSVYLSERLWKKNRVASIVVVTGVNVALAAIVANNYRIANSPARRSR